jgi:hemolysin activation/secretion protein
MRFVSAWCLTLFAESIHAQVDAGSLQQEIDRAQQLRLPRLLAPTEPRRSQVPPATSGPRITVRQFNIVGNTLIPSAQLERLVSTNLDRPLSFGEIEDVAARIAAHYREAGWTVKVFLPEQNVVNGVVTVQIIEAVLGSVRSEGPVARPSSLESIKKIIEASQRAGAFMSTQSVDRGLLIANDISGVYVSGNMVEGVKEAETDLLLKTLEKPFLESSVSYENSGSYATGPDRTAAMFSVNNFLMPGSVLNSQLAHTSGSIYGRIATAIPVDLNGLRFDVSASRLCYEIVNLPKEFDASGISNTIGVDLSYPVIRARTRNIYLNMGAERKKFVNFALGNLSSKYSSRTLSLGLSGNRETEFFEQPGSAAANITLTSGLLNMSGSPNEETLFADSNPAGRFKKVRFNLSQEQSLNEVVSAFVSISGQWAEKNLDSSEKFTLGGATGLRAYGSGEGTGAIGRMANFELRWRVSPAVTLTGFYDIGSVNVNVSNDFLGAPLLNRYSLKGGGVSAVWTVAKGMTFRASWARRTDQNPNANIETGKDQDGSLALNRFWLSANASF